MLLNAVKRLVYNVEVDMVPNKTRDVVVTGHRLGHDGSVIKLVVLRHDMK